MTNNETSPLVERAQARDGGGLRFNDGKPPIHLVPPSMTLAVASVLGYGAKKYAPRNWERGMKWSVPYDSMMRHLLAWQKGEDTDPESGLPHLHHAACNIAMLVEFMETYKEGDDRPGKGNDTETT